MEAKILCSSNWDTVSVLHRHHHGADHQDGFNKRRAVAIEIASAPPAILCLVIEISKQSMDTEY